MNVADKLAHINCTYFIEEKAQIIPFVIFFLSFFCYRRTDVQ